MSVLSNNIKTFLTVLLMSFLLQSTNVAADSLKSAQLCPLHTNPHFIIAVGGSHSLAVLNNGAVVTWGANGSGQLGDGTFSSSVAKMRPVEVLGLGPDSGVIALAGGGSFSLALKSDGTLRAWGENANGELGLGDTINRSSPVQIPGLMNVIATSSSSNHSLALKNDGTVWSWGNNSRGQLGNGTTNNSAFPVQVSGLTNIIGISAGGPTATLGYSLALKADGTVWAWGFNVNGTLGDNTLISKSLPVQVNGPGGVGFLTNIIKIAAGGNTAYALKSDGTMWGWGLNANGRLGDDSTTTRRTPVQIVGPSGAGSFLTNVVNIYGGGGQGMALTADGTFYTWGNNSSGQLGDGTFLEKHIPTPISFMGKLNKDAVITSFGGSGHTLLALNNGKVIAWGSNASGQLGNGNFTGSVSPVQVSGLGVGSGIGIVSASATDHTFAVKTDGSVLAWGSNIFAKLGDTTTITRFEPVLASALSGITLCTTGCFGNAILAEGNHSAALASDGKVWTWGIGNRIGNGTNVDSPTPVQVPGLTNIISIGTGGHTLALKSDGTVWSWGSNNDGRLGDGTFIDKFSPVQVVGPGAIGLTGITQIKVGNNTNLALRNDGAVFAWGLNSNGAVGDGTLVNRNMAVQILPPGSNVKALATDSSFSLALKNDGSVLVWGLNSAGALGNGTLSNTRQTTPVLVPSLGAGSNIVAIEAGGGTAMALKSDGTVLVWGANGSGQLGNGTLDSNPTPSLMPGMTNVAQIQAGGGFLVFRKSDGSILTIGADGVGQLGDGPNILTNTPSEPIQQSLFCN
jgi:alpha-tubulin suppressor-like RCC1 family protein